MVSFFRETLDEIRVLIEKGFVVFKNANADGKGYNLAFI